MQVQGNPGSRVTLLDNVPNDGEAVVDLSALVQSTYIDFTNVFVIQSLSEAPPIESFSGMLCHVSPL